MQTAAIVAAILASAWTAYLVLCNAAFNAQLSLVRSPYVCLPWAGVALLFMTYCVVK
jgi:hypothetical protein